MPIACSTLVTWRAIVFLGCLRCDTSKVAPVCNNANNNANVAVFIDLAIRDPHGVVLNATVGLETPLLPRNPAFYLGKNIELACCKTLGIQARRPKPSTVLRVRRLTRTGIDYL